MWGHISKPASIINRSNVCLRFSLTIPSGNLNIWKSTLALTNSSKLMSIMSGHQTWMETVLLGFIWLLSVVPSEFYSKIAKKEVCFQWKWIQKVHAAGKRWLTTHPKSIHLGLFCWVKSVEISSLFLTHLHPFQVEPFQLIYRCSCIARQVVNVHFSTTFIKSCLQCVMTKWIGCSWLSVLI